RITAPRSLAAVAFAERYAETCGVRGRKGRPAVAAAAEAATAEFVAQQVHTRLDLPLGIRIIACQVAAQLVDGDGLKSAVVVSSCAPQLRLLEWALADGHQYDWQSPVIQDANRTIQAGFVALLRDVAGDPYRPVAFDPPWLTSTVLALAQGIYKDRAFDRLPILADALQDAGCENPEILDHCRDPRLAHVRGCWAVDLVLGKS